MKNLTKIAMIALMVLGINSFANAQILQDANATASTRIIAPITIAKVNDMNFGNVYAGLGKVVLAPDGSRTVTELAVVSTSVAGTAASFTVGGESNYTFAITMPVAAHTLTEVEGAAVMSVDAFTSSLGATGTLDASGAATFSVGASLNVAAAQIAGEYTNAAGFTVSVNYN